MASEKPLLNRTFRCPLHPTQHVLVFTLGMHRGLSLLLCGKANMYFTVEPHGEDGAILSPVYIADETPLPKRAKMPVGPTGRPNPVRPSGLPRPEGRKKKS